ncbi:MAG: hypothetical protein QOD75_3253 [Blastocatellia bacterium]|jgi:hypothetical protein|nr:hypothetical protein [Blastocatellia bacterium]
MSLRSLLCIALLAVTCGPSLAQSAPQPRTIESIQKTLGRTVEGHPWVFVENRDFAARVEIDDSDSIASIHVFPKYLLRACEPDWEGPKEVARFSREEYLFLLAKLKSLQDTGSLLKVGTLGVFNNMRGDAVDEYGKAFIIRTVVPVAGQEGPGREMVHSFAVYFIRKVKGNIENRQYFPLSGEYRVRINGKTYLITLPEYDKATPGISASINAAGPLGKALEDCSESRIQYGTSREGNRCKPKTSLLQSSGDTACCGMTSVLKSSTTTP